MLKKSITIPNDVYNELEDKENFSALVTDLLIAHIRQKRISKAKLSFGIRDDSIKGVDYVNDMRAEGSRKLPELE